MASEERHILLSKINYLKCLIEKKENSTSKAVPPIIRKAPKGPSRSWTNPALVAPPAPAVSSSAQPAPVVSSKILVNPNFKGNKILVNPNFKQPKKILLNPAFQQPKSIHVNPKILSKPQSPKVLTPKSPGILFKSKNKLILKKQLVSPSRAKISKVSPLLYKSKNKLVRRTTAKKTPPKDLISNFNRVKTKQDKVTLIGGEQFVSNGGTRLTRLLSIKRQAMQRSISVLANKKRKSMQPCAIFRKLGHCPRGDACAYLHAPTQPLFKNKVLSNKNVAVASTKKKEHVAKKKDARYYQSEEQGESEAMRPQRNKTVGELPSFIPL